MREPMDGGGRAAVTTEEERLRAELAEAKARIAALKAALERALRGSSARSGPPQA